MVNQGIHGDSEHPWRAMASVVSPGIHGDPEHLWYARASVVNQGIHGEPGHPWFLLSTLTYSGSLSTLPRLVLLLLSLFQNGGMQSTHMIKACLQI